MPGEARSTVLDWSASSLLESFRGSFWKSGRRDEGSIILKTCTIKLHMNCIWIILSASQLYLGDNTMLQVSTTREIMRQLLEWSCHGLEGEAFHMVSCTSFNLNHSLEWTCLEAIVKLSCSTWFLFSFKAVCGQRKPTWKPFLETVSWQFAQVLSLLALSLCSAQGGSHLVTSSHRYVTSNGSDADDRISSWKMSWWTPVRPRVGSPNRCRSAS